MNIKVEVLSYPIDYIGTTNYNEIGKSFQIFLLLCILGKVPFLLQAFTSIMFPLYFIC